MGFLRKWMAGRYGSYGADALTRFGVWAYLGVYLAGMLLRWEWLYPVSFAIAMVTLYRLLSRNITRRRAENDRFLARTAPLRQRWRTARMIHSDKDHRYFKCPNCGRQLRVPKVAGTLKITCRACGMSFEKKI